MLLKFRKKSLLTHPQHSEVSPSSIPGSLSKGDLDVFVGVNKDEHVEVIELIKTIGFEEKKDTFRSDELCMLITDMFNYDVAIQVVVNGSQFEDFIKFRDMLRADNNFIALYNDIKHSNFQNDTYREKKSKFINRLLGEDKELHHFVIKTESIMNSYFNKEMSSRIEKTHWTMWIDTNEIIKNSTGLQLRRVEKEKDWNDLYNIRTEVESAFGVVEPKAIEAMIDTIKLIQSERKSHWYIIQIGDTFVGEFGIVDFDKGEKKVGRLQDIDILPSMQNKSYGNMLLKEVFNIGLVESYDSFCLMAETNDWPKYWYLKSGFRKVGEL